MLLPPTQSEIATTEQQKQAFVDALKPYRAGKPVIAVLASNEGTEMTDLLLPHAVLVRAGVADVQVVAPRSGRVALYPALQIDGAQDFAAFDRAHPGGADYVIVPAMGDADVPEVIAWLRGQVDRGARVLAVCSGALVAGRAGLLDGRRFAGHWYDRDTLLEHPGATYVPHQRYVIDRGVATTTGITASVPATLALIEAIGGRQKAQAIASELGVRTWDPQHDSSRFRVDVRRGWQYLMNKAAFWRDERRYVDVHDGVDDVALALTIDAWSRTNHVDVKAVSPSGPVTMRSGLVLVAQPPLEDDAPRMPPTSALPPLQQLDRTLCEVEERFGESQREWVMLEMEYADSGAEWRRMIGSRFETHCLEPLRPSGRKSTMSPRQVVELWVERFNAADVDGLVELYHADAVNHQVVQAPAEGRDAIRAMFEDAFAATEMTCIVEAIHEAGEVVALEWRDPLGLRGCGFFTVRDGRIAFQRGYWDKLSFLRLHGLPIE